MPIPDQSRSCWKPGDHIVLRGVWRHRLWWAAPVTVVQDDPHLVALYWPAGTPEKLPEERVTPQQLLSPEQVKLVDRLWIETDVLMLANPGAAHAVYAMWEKGQTSFRCWYVDLHEPLRRTSLGFDTMDHLLDIVISPDWSAWRWKDEDEFAEAVAIGVFSPEEARAIRAEGERVIRLLEAGAPPFCDGWERWSPPADWGIPCLPDGWDSIASKVVRFDTSGQSNPSLHLREDDGWHSRRSGAKANQTRRGDHLRRCDQLPRRGGVGLHMQE